MNIYRRKYLVMGVALLLAACDAGRGSHDASSSQAEASSSAGGNTNMVITDEKSLSFATEGLYPNDVYDADAGLSGKNSFTSMKAFRNGKYVDSLTEVGSRQDVKIELYGKNAMRFINVSNGYLFTVPSTEVNIDYTIAKYRTVLSFGDSILSVSFESSNPYTSLATPWYTYGSEWLMRHLMNEDFINNNGLTRTIPMNYDFSASNPYGDLTFKDGFDCYFFGIKINDDNGVIERPYYDIAVVRQKDDPRNFCLFVMKSKSQQSDALKQMVKSYHRVSSTGIARNYFYSEAAKPEASWDEATKGVFDHLVQKDYVNWGVFSYSMPGSEDSLKPGDANYDSTLSASKQVRDELESAWSHTFEIYPTYTHIGTGGPLGSDKFVPMHFPVKMANELAGGTGSDGKPLLQFTLQFTTNNNLVAGEVTPMFDILRGQYDEEFKTMAQEMKEYGKPILLRLNNEMNSDWTSYCGMMTLLDPDIFNMTWRRFHDILVKEGVTNVIWIWNPVSISCPYSSWGEDLCYFPGEDYVQLIGGTGYEMNNYDAATAASQIQSFEKIYTALYQKNCASFSTEWKVILSEFACGSGGETTGTLGRNAAVQAQWVRDMWKEMNATTPKDYMKQIRGAVWFNCNDYVGSQISNRLQLVTRPAFPSENYDDLADTMAAFAEGFANQDKKGK